MMKKKILSLAVTAGLVGAAATALAQDEMHINERGLGEVLIYPFYSAANGNDTYIHVVNTTSFAKAVKVRFIESQNSREVLDFNLYLSPEDAWAAVVTKNPNGNGAMVRTVDNSCTVPRLGTGGLGQFAGVTSGARKDQPFVNYAYDLAGEADRVVERTLEGYVEIIEMGRITNVAPRNFVTALTHTPAGTPTNCNVLVNAWSIVNGVTGAWLLNPLQDFSVWDAAGSAGGLYGFGVVINVQEGTSIGYDAVAIDNFVFPTDPALHTNSGDLFPSLASGQTDVAIVEDAAVSFHTFTPGVGTPAGSTNAVSALLMTQTISNDYVIDPAIAASSDWVVTFPTKRLYVDLGAPVTNAALRPFTRRWNPALSQACEPVGMSIWDREEAIVVTSTGPIFSPAPPATPTTEFNLCKEVNVISFGGSNSALNASNRILSGLAPNYKEGWARLSFTTGFNLAALQAGTATQQAQPNARTLASDGAAIFNGLPAVGFSVYSYQNGQLPGGVLSNYSASNKHKTTILVN
jgi:hypothetical protein